MKKIQNIIQKKTFSLQLETKKTLNKQIMKRKILQMIIVALLFIAATISCKKDEPLNGIILDETVTVYVGKTATIKVTFIPQNATNKKLSWESSDPNIATVDNGKVTGIAIGEVQITAISEDGGRTAKCNVYVIQPIKPEMVWVEGGTFTMGCTDEQGEDCRDTEKPSHKVTLSGFYIGKYEVSQKEWKSVMGKNPSLRKGDDLPVESVSLNDIQQFIQTLNATSGKNYRLPTEAEWEYAARGGNKSEGYKYSGSNDANAVAWFYENSGGNLHSVGTKKSNELGIYDMSGNIFEWCSDWYGNYTADPQTNPPGPTTGLYRLIRGGSIQYNSAFCRVSARLDAYSNYSGEVVGFRLVLPKN